MEFFVGMALVLAFSLIIADSNKKPDPPASYLGARATTVARKAKPTNKTFVRRVTNKRGNTKRF